MLYHNQATGESRRMPDGPGLSVHGPYLVPSPPAEAAMQRGGGSSAAAQHRMEVSPAAAAFRHDGTWPGGGARPPADGTDPRGGDGRTAYINPLSRRLTASMESVKRAMPSVKMSDWGEPHFENLNAEYILRHLDYDDLLLAGILLLFLTDDYAEPDWILILTLAFLLISEWIFED